MKRWAFLVAGLYCLILAVVMLPLTMLGMSETFKRAIKAPADGSFWLWLLVMFLGQIALLAVPVRAAGKRPVARRSLLSTILAAGFMAGGLAAAGLGALWEYADPKAGGSFVPWAMLGLMAAVWCLWSVIFWRIGRNETAENLVCRQCRALLKGSILELLVAVPTHIAVRQRHECCAGTMTFLGLVTGISVMLFSFGPAVFFLFAARWKRLHPAGSS